MMKTVFKLEMVRDGRRYRLVHGEACTDCAFFNDSNKAGVCPRLRTVAYTFTACTMPDFCGHWEEVAE